MGNFEKIVFSVLSGRNDMSTSFRDLCTLLSRLGFECRVKGSHHIFYRDDIEEIVNIQSARGGEAKPYQVKQVRNLILKYRGRGMLEDV